MKTLYMRAALGSIRQNLVLQKKQINYLRTVSLNETLKPFSSSFSSSIKPMLNQTDLVNDKKLENPDSLLNNFKHLDNKDNKKRDPNQKPSLEQLLILKEKLINHVKIFFY